MVCAESPLLPPGASGRPPQADAEAIARHRERAILDAASACFLAHGYAGTTLEDIASRCGRGKPSIYNSFGNKRGLLLALVRDRAARALPRFGTRTRLDRINHLTRVARQIHAAFTDPWWLDLMRLVIAENPRQPELGAALRAEALVPLESALARLFEQWGRKGSSLRLAPKQAASLFARLIVASDPLDLLIGASSRPSPDERRAHIDRAVAHFLQLATHGTPGEETMP